MKCNLMKLAAVLLVAGLATAPAPAAGPVDGELEAAWWNADFEVGTEGGNVSFDAGDLGFRGRLWFFEKWGVKGAFHSLDPDFSNEPFLEDESMDLTYLSLDIQRKVVHPTENNYLALGLGWEQIDSDGAGGDLDTSGLRLAAEGRVGFAGTVFGYAEAAWFPSLDDSCPFFGGPITFEEMDGYEYELGLGLEPAPFITLKAAYRVTSVDFDVIHDGDQVASADFEVSGFLLALGLHF